MNRPGPTPTLYDIVLDILTHTPRQHPDSKPVTLQAWNRAIAAAVEAAAAEAGGAIIRPAAADPEPSARQRPADEWDVAACAEILGIELAVIMSKAMDDATAVARQIICYVLHEATTTSYAAVGRLIGRDHSTVRHGCIRIARQFDSDPAVRAGVRACTAAVLCAPAEREAVA